MTVPDAQAAAPVRLPAPAKLNLFLHVTGRRADGYHLLETVFTFLDWADLIELQVTQDGIIRRTQALPGVPEAQDLCLRAAQLLAEASACGKGARIGAFKILPIGGGLGGGSSDAATVLLGLNRLWGLDWPRARLAELGLALGADVPVFVHGDSAFATGVGERLTPMVVPPRWYLVVVPAVAVPTASVFAAAELTRNTPPAKMADFPATFGHNDPRQPSGLWGHNDLEPVVCARYPEVLEVLVWLRQRTEARMTGSGCCVFAPFVTQAEALALQQALPVHWQSFLARGLQNHPLKDW